MAVLVEGISVIVRRDVIEKSYPSGWQGFMADVPNSTLCADDDLARVGFMHPDEVRSFVNLLSSRGLNLLANGRFADIAVVDQQSGPTMPCDWAEFAQLPWADGDGSVSACWLLKGPRVATGLHIEELRSALATPPGWEFENSLSAQFKFVHSAEAGTRLKYLRSEDGVDIFMDTQDGREVFIAPRRDAER